MNDEQRKALAKKTADSIASDIHEIFENREIADTVRALVEQEATCLLADRDAILRLEYERGYQEAKSETPIHTYASTGNRAAMNKNDLVRELEKIGDVLNVTNTHFQSEARMNAALHMSENVRPAPLAAAVQTACTSLDVLVQDILDNGLKGDS